MYSRPVDQVIRGIQQGGGGESCIPGDGPGFTHGAGVGIGNGDELKQAGNQHHDDHQPRDELDHGLA